MKEILEVGFIVLYGTIGGILFCFDLESWNKYIYKKWKNDRRQQKTNKKTYFVDLKVKLQSFLKKIKSGPNSNQLSELTLVCDKCGQIQGDKNISVNACDHRFHEQCEISMGGNVCGTTFAGDQRDKL